MFTIIVSTHAFTFRLFSNAISTNLHLFLITLLPSLATFSLSSFSYLFLLTYFLTVLSDSGFTRTVCGSKWTELITDTSWLAGGSLVSCPTCNNVDGSGGTAFASCVDGTNHIKADLTGTCSTLTCATSDCCDANPTCGDVDGSGADFSSCVAYMNHLKDDLTGTCATGTCTTSECCDANPTCDNIDGSGTDFSSCVSGTNHLPETLTGGKCRTGTCAASDCCKGNPT